MVYIVMNLTLTGRNCMRIYTALQGTSSVEVQLCRLIGPHTACLQPHIDSAMHMCKNYRQVLRRLYGFAGADTIKQLYVSLVRPHLEYGCGQVWDPHLLKDKRHVNLENV